VVSSIAQAQQPERAPIRLPNVSYGPFRLCEAVPWLMLATSFRFLAPQTVATMVTMHSLSGVCIFLAFLLATRRMIEFSGGDAAFAGLDFREQLILARNVLWRVVALILAASLLAGLTISFLAGWSLLWGVDGIAFDPFNLTETAWSSLLAAIILLMIVGAESGEPTSGRTSNEVSLHGAIRELAARLRHMAPALLAVMLIHVTLSAVQGVAREAMWAFWRTSDTPGMVKQLVYFFFVFGFASVRVWATLATLIFALRRSYRATAVLAKTSGSYV
jgi:hypothetical protein